MEDAESGNRKNAVDALMFRDGTQWPQTLYSEREIEGRLSVTVNHCDTFVSRVENSMRQQRPRIKVHPVHESDVDKAELITGLIRHVENRSKASVAYDAGGSMALSIGWGYWRIISEYVDEKSFDQELRIVPILNPFSVYRDPDSVLPDGSDSWRYIISTKIKRTLYKQRYPRAKNANWEPTAVGDDNADWESLDEIRLAEYFRIVEEPENLYKLADNTTRYESEFTKEALKAALADPKTHNLATEKDADGNTVAVVRKSSRRKVQWFLINGTEIVDRKSLPGRYIPIVAVQGNTLDINGKRSRSGMIKNMIEPARLVNYWETMKTERLALAPKAEWTAYEGVIEGHPEWHDANRKAYSVLVGKAVSGPDGVTLPLPIKAQPPGVEAGFAEAMQSAYSALQAIAGMPHEPGQDAKGEVISGIALQERRELADVTHFQYYDNQTISIAFTGELLLSWIPYVYSGDRQQRIIGEDGVPQMKAINTSDGNGNITPENDLTIGQYAVVMDTGPGYDTKRQEGKDVLLGVLPTPMGEVVAQKAPDLFFRALDTAYSEQIADRLAINIPEELKKIMQSLPERAQNIIKAQIQANQNLQQQLQSAQMDLKHGLTKTLHQDATKLQIEQLRDGRAEHDTLLDTHIKKYDTDVKSHTAIGVAEINAGAKLIDSNQDRAHEKVLAQMTADAAERAEKSDPKAA